MTDSAIREWEPGCEGKGLLFWEHSAGARQLAMRVWASEGAEPTHAAVRERLGLAHEQVVASFGVTGSEVTVYLGRPVEGRPCEDIICELDPRLEPARGDPFDFGRSQSPAPGFDLPGA